MTDETATTITEIAAELGKARYEIAELKRQLSTIHRQLAAAEKDRNRWEHESHELRRQLVTPDDAPATLLR